MPTLTLAGPGEFLPDRTPAPVLNKARAAVLAPLTLAAYSRLGYTSIFLSPAAAAWFTTHAKALPPRSTAVVSAPVSLTVPAGEKTVGLLLLPFGNGPEGAPTAEQLDAVLLAARTLQRKTECVIAVSPWGLYAESALLPRLDGFVQLLLGAGPGVGFPGQDSASRPGLLWARSDTKGRTVTVIDILRWPDPGASFHWTAGVTYTARELPLGSDIPADKAMIRLLAPVPEDVE